MRLMAEFDDFVGRVLVRVAAEAEVEVVVVRAAVDGILEVGVEVRAQGAGVAVLSVILCSGVVLFSPNKKHIFVWGIPGKQK